MDRDMRMKTLLFAKLDELIPEGTCYKDAVKILEKRATREHPFWSIFTSDTCSFVSPSEEVVNLIADYFDGTYDASCITGYYDVLYDLEENVSDWYTGMYYVDVVGGHD